ncbi:MAG TPA: G1 family glutamic endopeptidase [Solirubrobacteraceae bacterium]|nr:G1 family glutamic endopeptidase [Solirubrobacteraceae bacterium]
MALPGTSHAVGARRVGVSLCLALVGALGWLLTLAAGALADSTQSSNWAGYAVHRRGVTFTQVAGQWTQPTVSCVPGPPSYSSIWVGIGGYSESSRALEQIGTEADCSGDGTEQSSAWFELVPAPSTTISLPVAPGDGVRATVTLSGHEVSFELEDLTTGRSFTRRLHARLIDATSAEWIVEAPSVCSGHSCQALPLADFGSTGFAFATATASPGVSGTVLSPYWRATKITLVEDAQRLFGADRAAGPVSAVPGPLAYNGSLFPVTFAGAAAAAPDRISGGHIFH